MSQRVNTRLTRKGALAAVTYEVLRLWDGSVGWKEHLQVLRDKELLPAPTEKWRREVLSTLSQRFPDPDSVVLDALTRLAKQGESMDVWLPLLHVHLAQTDRLFWRFSTEWLWERKIAGCPSIAPSDVASWIQESLQRDISNGQGLSEYGQVRLARDLVRMGTDVRILTAAGSRKELQRVQLKSDLLVFLLQLLSEETAHPSGVVESPFWHVFLWSRDDLVRELVELDQFGRIGYLAAGSIVDLRLPASSARAYLEEWLPR